MSCISKIRRFIYNLEDDSIFTTRDLLNSGSRCAIDQALSRLVKKKLINRLCRGVFLKPGCLIVPAPSVLEVAGIKARSFGKEIYMHGMDAVRSLAYRRGYDTTGGLLTKLMRRKQHDSFGLRIYNRLMKDKSEAVFATNGASSSFVYMGVRIKFRSTSPRKLALRDSFLGRFVRATAILGPLVVDPYTLSILMTNFDRESRRDIRSKMELLPSWLTNFLQPTY